MQKYVITAIERLEDWGDLKSPLEEPAVSLMATVRVETGATATISFALPEDWNSWTREEKLAFGRTRIEEHLTNYNYEVANRVEYPNPVLQVDAQLDLEDMPGWATWTAQEAESWIRANVTTQADLLELNVKMARMLCYLRDIALAR